MKMSLREKIIRNTSFGAFPNSFTYDDINRVLNNEVDSTDDESLQLLSMTNNILLTIEKTRCKLKNNSQSCEV